MNNRLNIGDKFSLPLESVARTFAFMGIVGSGKTSTAKRMAEEMSRNGLPWIALDPVGVWWGIRANPDGTPSPFPVVVIGGPRGDLPLEKASGAKIAQALVHEQVCAVIDLSRESKKFWHSFVTDFALELMRLNPNTPRHIFLEEAPEFVPQRTKIDLTARCKEAVERLVRLGRNSGYGFSLITQRPATVDKDVLSQCENLFMLRTVGKHDRKALDEWTESIGADSKLNISQLSTLETGSGWFWSPSWLRELKRVKFTESGTFHPGATRKIGNQIAPVELSDVAAFVSRLQKQLSIAPMGVDKQELERRIRPVETTFDDNGQAQILRDQLTAALQRASNAESKLAAVKRLLEPDYKALAAIFENLSVTGTSVDSSIYDPWLKKAGQAGCRRLLETLIERRTLTKAQLGTLAGVSYKQSTFRAYMAWLKRNGLIRVEGETVSLLDI